MTHQCLACGIEKPVTDYFVSKSAKRGHNAECKACAYERMRGYRKKNWEQCYATRQRYREANAARCASLTRKSVLKVRYGLTPEQYAELLKAQDGKCAICGITPERKLCVDHCHTTNRVRGLLCDHCNRGIGAFRDNPSLLLKAAKFIRAVM